MTMTAKLTNTTPDGQSQFIGGPYPGSSHPVRGLRRRHRGQPPGSGPSSLHHRDQFVTSVGSEGPTWVLGGNLVLLQGQSTTVVFRFTMPGKHGSMTVVPSARIPAEQWTSGGRTFDDTVPTTVSW